MSTNPQNTAPSNVRSVALGCLFSSAVIVIERQVPGDPADLAPDERQYVVRARPKRQQEFAAGRACARSALAGFGRSGDSIKVAEDRQPLWPDGFVGSITHTAGFCAAAAARQCDVAAIGLDSETVGAPTVDIWPTICRTEELAWIDSLPEPERPAGVTLVFSAKEAFYKCQYPLVREWLDFHDLRIEIAAWGGAAGTFTVTAQRAIRFAEHRPLPFMGRYVFHDRYISAGVAVLAAQ